MYATLYPLYLVDIERLFLKDAQYVLIYRKKEKKAIMPEKK